VLPEKQGEMAGAVHADGTARFQSLFTLESNLFLFDLLDYLDKNHQVKALINTSFNAAGEPIVHTREDALKSAQKMGIDGVVVNGELEKIGNFY
jgi:carbamoyltransferase